MVLVCEWSLPMVACLLSKPIHFQSIQGGLRKKKIEDKSRKVMVLMIVGLPNERVIYTLVFVGANTEM